MITEQNASSQILTSSGIVGASGKQTRVFCVHIVSAGTAGNATLKNGTDTNGTAQSTYLATINTGTTFVENAQGLHFPSGCFASFDANVSRCVVTYTHS
jgi:hypothetical protein